MRYFAPLTVYALGLTILLSPHTARASGEIVAEPAVITPGQTVKLRWYFTGTKVVVAGGRFGAGTVVTGKTLITDTPHKTTKYTFDVYYNGTETNAKGERVTGPLHQQYTVLAKVDTSPPDIFRTYSDNHGWRIGYLAGWRYDASDTGSSENTLLFFQRELDSLERMAVAIVPSRGMSAEEVIAKAMADTPERYENVTIDPTSPATVGGLNGAAATFSGNDNAHDHIRTTTLLFAVVSGGRAYVISARTRASEFDTRRPHLERMLRSFALPHGATTDVAIRKTAV